LAVRCGRRVQSASVTADGQRVILGARDNLARAFDRSGKLAWQFPATNSVLGVDISPDGRWTAVASEDRNVYLLDEAGKPLWQHKAERAMNNAAVADDGSLVAATSDDRSFYVLDGKGKLLWHNPLGIDVRAWPSMVGRGCPRGDRLGRWVCHHLQPHGRSIVADSPRL